MIDAEKNEVLRQARNYALRRIAQMSYSTHGLRRLMIERLIPKEIVNQIIDDFVANGYLDDGQWLQSFYRQEIARKSGPGKIRMKLMQKGFSQETISQFFQEKNGEERDESEEQPALIRRLLETRYRTRDLKDPKERQKVVAGLMRQGFDYEEIKKMILCSNE
jgi:regulatory protein